MAQMEQQDKTLAFTPYTATKFRFQEGGAPHGANVKKSDKKRTNKQVEKKLGKTIGKAAFGKQKASFKVKRLQLSPSEWEKTLLKAKRNYAKSNEERYKVIRGLWHDMQKQYHSNTGQANRPQLIANLTNDYKRHMALLRRQMKDNKSSKAKNNNSA